MKKITLNHFITRCNILLCLLFAGLVFQPLAAQTYTFTACGASGQIGPTQTQVNNTYVGANSLNGLVTISGQGIQQWTVPGGGNYYIKAVGASGGPPISYVQFGKGASIEGVFNLAPGTVLKIIVGQQGQPSGAGGSGGGGSFVADNTNLPLIVAGGGSGGGNYANPVAAIMDGRVTNYGANYQSTGRAAAGGGGGSFSVSGLNANGGTSFIGGGVGGALGGSGGGYGGFGGGGGSSGSNALAAGGGGYSGGDEMYGYQVYQAQEGGGGSYNAGTNQVNAGGVNTGDGIVIITRLCNISLVPSQNPICIGASITLTTNAVSGITWGNSPSTGNSILVNPLVSTNYSVTGTSTANCQTTNVITVTVNPLPVISVVSSPTTLCVGSTATVAASGANTYTWSAGNASATSATITPVVNTTYTVTATSVFGCVNTQTASVKVNTNILTPVPQATTICNGSSAYISANGAVSYTWSNGAMFQTTPVSPTVTTSYVVSAMDSYNCPLTSTVNVVVTALPPVTISTTKTLVCKGEAVTLTGNGATTYTWNNGFVGSIATYTLPVDVIYYYSVIGSDNGCNSTANIAVAGAKCLGVSEINHSAVDMTLIPNPGAGLFNLQVNSVKDNLHIRIYNALGMLIKSELVITGNNQFDLRNEKAGIYFIYVTDNNVDATQVIKLIKE